MKIDLWKLFGKSVRLTDLALKLDAAWDEAERLAPQEQTLLSVVKIRVGRKRFSVGPFPVLRED